MKKFLLILGMLCSVTLGGCTQPKIVYKYKILDKYSTKALLFRAYFFKLDVYGEKEVDQYTYRDYNIGDFYTWDKTI